MLIKGDPIASAALAEFNRPDLVGSFVGCPLDGDTEKLRGAGDPKSGYYVAASMALMNASPDLRDPAHLGVGVYVFEPEPEREQELSEAFLSSYGIIEVFRQAYKDTNDAMSPDERAGIMEVRQWVFRETVRGLAAERRRLIGGYAMLASTTEPRQRSGFMFYAKELREQYQFAAREAALRGALDGIPEELRRSRLVMQADSDIDMAALGTIMRKLLPTEKLEAALNGAKPE